MEKDHEIARPSIEDAIENTAVVTAELAELPVDLRTMRERKVRPLRAQQVDARDLVVDDNLMRWLKRLDEIVDGCDPSRSR